jgi:hypothetical protein
MTSPRFSVRETGRRLMFDPPVFGVNPSQPVAAVSTGMGTARVGLRAMQMVHRG